MARYMLDTDICIYVMKNRPPGVRERFDAAAGDLCISTVTLAELHFGAEKSTRRADSLATIEPFASSLDVLPFDAEAAVHYAQIRAALERAGQPAGLHDMMIGGHARAEGLVVVTNNVREFKRMPGLRVENWL